MQLDLMKPLLVVPGRWNAAIFSGPWLVKHFFGCEEETVEGTIVELIDNAAIRKSIMFVNGIGFSASDNRIEVFGSTDFPACLEDVKTVTKRLLDVLSHTPVSAFGFNLRFFDIENNEAFDQQLQIQDPIELDAVRTNIKIKTTYEFNGMELNIERDELEKSITLNFHNNFSPTITPHDSLEQFDILKAMDHATEFIEKCFGTSEFSVTAFDNENQRGNNDYGSEAASTAA